MNRIVPSKTNTQNGSDSNQIHESIVELTFLIQFRRTSGKIFVGFSMPQLDLEKSLNVNQGRYHQNTVKNV